MSHSILEKERIEREHYVRREEFITRYIRSPLWAIQALPKSNRPHPEWPIERVVRRKAMWHDAQVAIQYGCLSYSC